MTSYMNCDNNGFLYHLEVIDYLGFNYRRQPVGSPDGIRMQNTIIFSMTVSILSPLLFQLPISILMLTSSQLRPSCT